MAEMSLCHDTLRLSLSKQRNLQGFGASAILVCVRARLFLFPFWNFFPSDHDEEHFL